MESYLSVKNHEIETVISRSKFITLSFHIESEDEAMEILRQLDKKYSDATHICYAYVSDILGNCARFSDSGEPSGTAGRPIMDAIQKNGIRQVLVAVVRYFGGVKLGAGGLTRAYSGCACQIIDKAEKIRYVLSDIYRVTADFQTAEKLKNFFAVNCKILGIDYSDTVTISVASAKNVDLEQVISEKSGGRAKIERLKTQYIIY